MYINIYFYTHNRSHKTVRIKKGLNLLHRGKIPKEDKCYFSVH